MSRYVSNADLARMQARYANQRGVPVSKTSDTGVGITRRQRTDEAVRDLYAEVQEKANRAIDLAETALRRQRTLNDAAKARRSRAVRS